MWQYASLNILVRRIVIFVSRQSCYNSSYFIIYKISRINICPDPTPWAYGVISTSMRRHHVTSTFIRRHFTSCAQFQGDVRTLFRLDMNEICDQNLIFNDEKKLFCPYLTKQKTTFPFIANKKIRKHDFKSILIYFILFIDFCISIELQCCRLILRT